MGRRAILISIIEPDIQAEGCEIGDICNQNYLGPNVLCQGELEEKYIDGCCSCHTGFAPCGWCTAGRVECPECGWEQEDA